MRDNVLVLLFIFCKQNLFCMLVHFFRNCFFFLFLKIFALLFIHLFTFIYLATSGLSCSFRDLLL